MLDTLRTTSGGALSFFIQCMEFIPELVRVLVGIVTIVYFVVQIRKDLK